MLADRSKSIVDPDGLPKLYFIDDHSPSENVNGRQVLKWEDFAELEGEKCCYSYF